MNIKNFSVENFRNLKNININPHEGVNVIYGENAQGKTNLLESIWMLTGARSFRGAADRLLIGEEKEKTRISAEFDLDNRKQTLQIQIENKREAILNGVKQQKPSDLAGNICAIVFSPSDLELITEGPEKRRKFLDTAICQLYPAYIEKSREYLKAVAQRNSLFKKLNNSTMIDVIAPDFEIIIAKKGSEIIRYRMRYVELINNYIEEIYSGFTNGEEKISVKYDFSGSENEKELLLMLSQSREKDKLLYSTSVGPHRDNLDIKIDNKEIKGYGSQGQKRSAALSLKLAEAKILKQITKKEPLLLLDDVMSELDTKRQDYVLNRITDKQVFITCCDPSNIKGLNIGKIFHIKKGRVSEQ